MSRIEESSHSFRLSKTFVLPFLGSAHSFAHFPWDALSVQTLWEGKRDMPELQENWKTMIDLWSSTMVVAGSDAVVVVSPSHPSNGFCIKVPQDDDQNPFRAVAWALSNEAPFDPLIVCSRGRILYVLDAKQKTVIGKLRGHGGEITAIAVHPSFPYLVCTCSRDFSARLYDLTMPPRDAPNNPHWPPSMSPSLGGAPHGLQSSEPEGVGTGRCVAVLCGGPSGGHNAAVLNASFHPTYPLLATCGLDRAVKIWVLPKLSFEEMAREDKPLFSSSRIHQARIMSVNWLSLDVLVTHSAPALMRRNGQKENIYLADGTIAIWRWLGFDRFFPPNTQKPSNVMRGCASDYQESSSFKLLSVAPISQLTRHLHVAYTLRNNYVIAITLPDRIRLHNVADFQPRQRPSFPLGENDGDDIPNMNRLHLDEEGDEEEHVAPAPKVSQRAALSPPLEGKDIVIPTAGHNLQAVSLGCHGLSLMALGANGQIWIWTDATD
ncbi:WD40-repeat-containing domain protein [Boletus edulis BED1]|uniref:WD40-repeat-containing domain protein n=1 Tax=Boletus edulis BED1 TaxID=1328754 RepID=A0AAD4C209_BOLED|nr:WD40-repeat-containing domain protein [Boletus edulis BED1]